MLLLFYGDQGKKLLIGHCNDPERLSWYSVILSFDRRREAR